VQRQWRAGAILPNRRRWQPTTFTKNRDRLLAADVTKEFLAEVVNQAKQKGLTSDQYFMVDGRSLKLGPLSAVRPVPERSQYRLRQAASTAAQPYQFR
jgi:hypothetical protein